jgi:hypothetical protein
MKTVVCDPDVVNFTKSFKSIGYNHYSAILDLIDNSVSAGATKVWVDYSKDRKGNYQTIIADNGCGMERNELIEAMRIASSDPTTVRTGKDLGKFGLGLKLASFSQTDRFSVISHKKSKNLCGFKWDLEFVRKEKKWLLQEIDVLKFTKPKSQGTEVILFDVFKGIDIIEDQVFSKLRTHIAVAYSMMKGIKFYINDKEIEPIDPFFSDSLASNHSSFESVHLDAISIEIQSHQIPHANKMKPKEKRLYLELIEIGMGPGLYIYRKNRLIAWAGWEGLGKDLRINDLYRLSVFCQDDADGLFNIEVKKSQISVTDNRLRTELKRSITHFSDIARKPYQKRALLSLKDLSDLWHLEKNSSGKVIFTINKTSDAVKLVEKGKMKLSELLVMLESTIPYESLLYYLNLNKVDIPGVNHKKIETAEMMFKIGILTKNELDKLREKYGS